METFEDWIKALKFSLSIRGKACSEKAWNHQQKKIDELEKELNRYRHEDKYLDIEAENIDLEAKLQVEREKRIKLLDLMLLTDPVVSDIVVGDTQLKQHQEFLRTFPDEREKLGEDLD